MILSKKKYFFLLLIFIFPLVSFANQNKTTFTKESEFKKVWHLDYKEEGYTSSIFEWTKADENVYNWTELITAQLLKNCYNKREFYDVWIALIKHNIPNNLWYEKIVFEEEDNILAFWAILPPNSLAQKELVKIIETKDGLFLIRYTCRGNVEMTNKWNNFILHAQYENNFLISE